MPIIVHLDLDAFYASVEILLDPRLAGRPLVIGADPQRGYGRGVVATASYEARRFGIRSAMPISEAYRRCPSAIFRPPRFDVYQPYSNRVMERIRAVAETVEQVSIDEAFFTTGQDYEASLATAGQLQAEIKQTTGLGASLGIASGKLVAKVASDLRKPFALVGVPPGEEAAFLAPLPVDRIWGVGPVTMARLVERGISTIGQLAALDDTALSIMLGSRGPELGQLARGIDERPLVTGRERQQISREHTFLQDTRDLAQIEQTLGRLADEVARRMAARQLWARTVTLRLRYQDFTTLSRRLTPGPLITEAGALGELSAYLLATTIDRRQAVRLVGVGVEGLEPAGTSYQLPLFGWRQLVADAPAGAEPGQGRPAARLDDH